MGNLYLVTSLYDEGIYPDNFRVVKAESELKIAADMLAHPSRWQEFLAHVFSARLEKTEFFYGSLWDCIREATMTPERLLELIKMTRVDGDSEAQLAINQITVEQLFEVSANF